MQQGIPIPRPPQISTNPVSGATIQVNEQQLFMEGINRAGQLESTCEHCSVPPSGVGDGNPVPGELDPLFPQSRTNSNGLGARHNGDQCLVCHAQPVLGGSGGFLVPNPGSNPPQQAENPQFNLIPHRFGKQNVVPDFELQYGPIREVRFKTQPNGQPDGSVHQLWIVKGITTDSTIPNCNISQPDFATAEKNNNISFRIPLQTLGLGLIESISDTTILNSFNATLSARQALNIAGRPNRSGNDNTITRFGWKAQNKSMAIFAGEAYNVEMGVTNEAFPQETEEDQNCNGPDKPEPNDVVRTDTNDAENHAFNNPLHILPDWMQFMLLMRFTDGPAPAPANTSDTTASSVSNGQKLFSSTGCALCHTPQMTTEQTGQSPVLEFRPVNLFSDLLIHHMGPRLADGISQGLAGGDEFRTVPLWGVGQRIFFLHDGRTNDLLQAIRFHAALCNGYTPIAGTGATTASCASAPDGSTSGSTSSTSGSAPSSGATTASSSTSYPQSEATAVIRNFNSLNSSQQQAILNFLRSL